MNCAHGRVAPLATAVFVLSVLAAPLQPNAASPADESFIDGALLAAHLPRIQYLRGSFVRRPRLVTVTFAGDDPLVVSRVEQFGSTITRTRWWRAVADGYCAGHDCVGEGRPAAAVRLDDPLPGDVHAVDVSALLRRQAGAGRFGRLDSESLLLVYLPPGVTLRDAFVARYCGEGPRGFHRALRLDGMQVGYAVMPRCGDEAALTATASHELLEMTLSPDPASPGFAFAAGGSNHGFAAAGNEAMDPCGFITKQPDIDESGFTVRRAWSNRAASQGRDPCVPTPADRPFTALVPAQPAVRMLNDGETAILSVRAAADRRVAGWSVSAVDLTGAQEHTRYVDVALDRTHVAPGEAATLTLTRRKAHPKGHSVVGIVSTIDSNTYLWPVAVITR
jgi:hypothetical protein